MSIYSFSALTIDQTVKDFTDYEGKVLLIVNTASKCGFTPQFTELEALYQGYNERGLEILGFPCNQFAKQDPGSEEEIASFCQENYGVTFQMFAKVKVNGEHAHPLFTYLTEQAGGLLTKQIKWNFTKFLIDRHGQVIKRYAPQTKPSKIAKQIDALL